MPLFSRVAMEISWQEVDPNSAPALVCLNAYFAEIATLFSQGFQRHLSCDPETHELTAPRGAFLLAVTDRPVGCVAIKGTDKGYAEIKRLWVDPSMRGQGLATRLMAESEIRARVLGYTLLRLDTHSCLPGVVEFYHKQGWNEISRYNEDPYPDHFFEKPLSKRE